MDRRDTERRQEFLVQIDPQAHVLGVEAETPCSGLEFCQHVVVGKGNAGLEFVIRMFPMFVMVLSGFLQEIGDPLSDDHVDGCLSR